MSTRRMLPRSWLACVLVAACCQTAPTIAHERPQHARAQPVAPAGVNRDAFARLLKRAVESSSDALVLMKDGKTIWESYFDKPRGRIEAMSATKSIVSLLVGKLIDSGRIKSLDQPVYDFFPEWRQGRKQKITLRHLLNHTSGLQNEPTTNVEIYPSRDYVKLALAAELSEDPGSKFSYNNKAVNLLAGIIRIAAGQPMDEYARDALFAPMGITDVSWEPDPAGTPQAMAGLQIRAGDLAKIGQMLLEGGMWQGKRIVSQAWIAESMNPGQPLTPRCGLLWWLLGDFRQVVADDELIARWRRGGVSDAFVARVLPLENRVFLDGGASFWEALEGAFGTRTGMELWYDNTSRKGLPEGKLLEARVSGFYAKGYLGQYLVVIPSQRIVAVRQRRSPGDVDESKIDMFTDFPELVMQLASP